MKKLYKLQRVRMQAKLSLYLVASSLKLSEDEFLNKMELALKGGVDALQLREKTKSSREFYNIALKLSKLCKAYNKPFIINDRLDIALAVNADGLHIGQEDLPVCVARKLLGKDKILGLSTSKVSHLTQLEGVDYLGIGAIYPTPTKQESKAIGISGLKTLMQKTSLPVVVIGGINSQNLEEFKGLGVAGYAVVRELMDSLDIYKKSLELKQEITRLA